MSIGSADYKYLKYTTNNASVNHPSYDRDLDSSFSSYDSKLPPSRTKSAAAIVNNRLIESPNEQSKTKSFISEPVKKKSSMPLTEEVLALHNSVVPPFQQYEFQDQLQVDQGEEEEEEEEDYVLEQSLLDRVDERCKTMQQEFDEKIKQLEAQFTKAEQDFSQSRCDIEELSCMEKEYINQGIQTELCTEDIKKVEEAVIGLSLESKEYKDQANEWKSKAEGLQEFVNQTKKIIWDTPFIPMSAICRQLPTNQSIDDDDEDICDYHRKRIEKFKSKSDTERQLYLNDNNATLNRMSNWSKAIKHY